MAKIVSPARKLLERLIGSATMLIGMKHIKLPPGRIVENLSPEEREVLKTLTSEDTLNMRVEPWEIEDHER